MGTKHSKQPLFTSEHEACKRDYWLPGCFTLVFLKLPGSAMNCTQPSASLPIPHNSGLSTSSPSVSILANGGIHRHNFLSIEGAVPKDLEWNNRSIRRKSSDSRFDRIPAFIGIVDKYKELTSDDFLAGLWRLTIEWNLVWRAEELGQRYDSYVAPSWSWLSLKETPIRGGPELTILEVKLGHVLQAEVTPSPGKSKYCWILT